MADRSFLGWPFFDDAHRALAARLESWVERELAPLTADEPAGTALDDTTKQLLTALAGGGWLAYCVPAAWGGKTETLDVRSLCLIRETLAHTSGLADFAFAMQGLGSAPITLFGSDALRADILPGIVRGEKIGAFALSEPQAGSNPAEITTAARRGGADYLIDGEKTWISNAGLATQYVVFARTGEPGPRGLSAFVVPADALGLKVAERIDVIAPHPLGRLRFENCRAPESHRLADEGDGYTIAMATLGIFRATVGAAALGFARRALDEAISWSASRRIGDQPLAEYQMTKDKIADMVVAIDAAALLVYRAAWTLDVQGTKAARESSEAKLFATEAAQQVIDHAVQLHGGQGVVSGATVEVLYREIRALRVYEGTSEIQKLIIARETLRDLTGGAVKNGSAKSP